MTLFTHIPSSNQPAKPQHQQRLLYLASRSPRREQLLTEAGYAFETIIPDVDDSHLARGAVDPEMWVQALAYFKAMAGAHKLRTAPASTAAVPTFDIPSDVPSPRTTNTIQSAQQREPVVLGADTICVIDNRIIGKPQSNDEAAAMIARFANTSHDVLTGVALLDLHTHSRVMFTGTSRVRFGDLSQSAINRYIDSNGWQGKAGGYNLTERIAGGWDIDVQGDPTNVVGLPMELVSQKLAAQHIFPACVSSVNPVCAGCTSNHAPPEHIAS